MPQNDTPDDSDQSPAADSPEPAPPADTDFDGLSEHQRSEIPTTIDFHRLAQGQAEVRIRFSGNTYRLRRTRQGKLILTK